VRQFPADIEDRVQRSSWWANVLGGYLVALGVVAGGAYVLVSRSSRQDEVAAVLLIFAGSILIVWLSYWMAPLVWRMSRGRPLKPNE
jgi:bacteriorhodopsin